MHLLIVILLLLNGLVLVLGLVSVIRDMRLTAQAVARVNEIADRNERMSAKVLTMLAGIEAEDQ